MDLLNPPLLTPKLQGVQGPCGLTSEPSFRCQGGPGASRGMPWGLAHCSCRASLPLLGHDGCTGLLCHEQAAMGSSPVLLQAAFAMETSPLALLASCMRPSPLLRQRLFALLWLLWGLARQSKRESKRQRGPEQPRPDPWRSAQRGPARAQQYDCAVAFTHRLAFCSSSSNLATAIASLLFFWHVSCLGQRAKMKPDGC